MSVQVSAIYQAQNIATGGATKLNFTTLNAILNGGTVVPVGCIVLLTSLWVTNLKTGIITLRLYRGTAATDQFSLTGATALNIPPSTIYAPGYQVLTAPIVLMPGDAIWGNASAITSLNITGDGQVITQ